MTVYAENRRAKFDFEILEEMTAGVELTGSEVKSVRLGKVSLAGSHVSVRGGEAFLLGADIEAYQPKNQEADYDPSRAKKLLLSKEEIGKLEDAEGTKGLTIVPISLYNKGRFIKLNIALARGKKLVDKRESIKKRDVERDLDRKL